VTRDVVLLHGLWMNRHVMAPLARRLAQAGFVAHAVTYRSVARGLDDHVERVARLVDGLGTAPVHFVAHSMGGLVTAAYLARARPGTADRVVLLGAPLAGCHAGRELAGHRAWCAALGASARMWRAHGGCVLPAGVTAGAIAGTGRIGLGRFFVKLADPNDGVVRVAETRIPGLADHVVLPVSHSVMLIDIRVARETVHFLRHGRFSGSR
jgi:pimeloyl-ACP methyl ester carboxylesterase